MNANIGSNESAVTAGFANAGEVKRPEPHLTRRIVKCLVAPALVALMLFGAHWQVFGSVSGVEPEVVYEEDDVDYFPPAYAFRALDFDDPFNAY